MRLVQWCEISIASEARLRPAVLSWDTGGCKLPIVGAVVATDGSRQAPSSVFAVDTGSSKICTLNYRLNCKIVSC